MEIKNTFETPAGVGTTWRLLTDVEKVASCMPGAELTEMKDDGTFRGKVKVKIGPISLSFSGEAQFEELDESAKLMRMKAKGKELRGRGAAEAMVTSVLTPSGASSTEVVITTDLKLTGAVAQYGRNMVSDVSTHLVGQFANCLKSQLAGTEEEAQTAVAEADKGVPGIRLFLSTTWKAIKRFFGRVTGRGKN